MIGVYGREDVPLLTAEEAAALDRRAQDGGIPERALMENAGRALAQVVQRLYPDGNVLAVVGSGNNGGDALVALRSLCEWGRDVAYIPAGSHDPDVRLLAGVAVRRIGIDDAPAALARAGVILDGILGTGASGAPREPAATLVRQMNGSGRDIVALDIPTGVDPTTGQVPGEVVRAAVTVQFGWPKTGAMFQPGRACCGRIMAVEIGFPPLHPEEPGARVITPDWGRARLPYRPPDAHKNSVGRVLIVAGRKGMGGAPTIAARSAMRAGAGYVRVASAEANRVIIQSRAPETLFVDREDRDAVAGALEQSDAVLIGPALGTGEDGQALLDLVLDGIGDRGCILDADALTILAGRERGLGALQGRRILATPHPGEMSRLTGRPVAEIRRDPIGQARFLAQATGVTILLKGAPSVVAEPDRPVLVSTIGSSDLATAAMGDQLGAEAAAFLAGGATPAEAAALGLLYGGRAAVLAARGRSLVPDDVCDAIHLAFDDPGPAAPPLDLPFVVFDQPAPW